MPQFTEFPALPPGEPARALTVLLDVLRAIPAEGEPFRELRRRLKGAELWSRERLPQLLRFFRLVQDDPIRPSPLVRGLAGGEAACQQLLADRLWEINPLLFTTVFQRLEERVHSVNELLKYLDSFAYAGTRLSGPEVRAWLRLGQALGLFRLVGIALALTDQARATFGPRILGFDVEEFLEEDQDEPEVGVAAEEPAPAPVPAPVAPPPVVVQAPPPPAREAPPVGVSPLGRGRPVPAASFRDLVVFAEPERALAAERILAWWGEEAVDDPRPTADDFGLDAEAFQEDPDQGIFRLGVAAALAFGPDAHRAVDRFAALRDSGALDALHAGTRPDGPVQVDADALITASVVARRVAEAPDLAATLERADDAAGAFEALEAAFGRGLFGLELFWMLWTLAGLGVIRRQGAEAFATLPDRRVRDVLYRLGFLATPYAADMTALRAAAAAAAPFGAGAHHTLTAFARAAGCGYGCAQRRRCDLPCRERADLG